MFFRAVVGLSLFLLGYLIGKEVGRTESIRDQLRWDAEHGRRGEMNTDVEDVPDAKAPM
jgi:hypothetical protein